MGVQVLKKNWIPILISSSHILLVRSHLFLVLVNNLEDDLLRPLPIRQVNFNSCLPSRKFFLSWTTVQNVFRALYSGGGELV